MKLTSTAPETTLHIHAEEEDDTVIIFAGNCALLTFKLTKNGKLAFRREVIDYDIQNLFLLNSTGKLMEFKK